MPQSYGLVGNTTIPVSATPSPPRPGARTTPSPPRPGARTTNNQYVIQAAPAPAPPRSLIDSYREIVPPAPSTPRPPTGRAAPPAAPPATRPATPPAARPPVAGGNDWDDANPDRIAREQRSARITTEAVARNQAIRREQYSRAFNAIAGSDEFQRRLIANEPIPTESVFNRMAPELTGSYAAFRDAWATWRSIPRLNNFADWDTIPPGMPWIDPAGNLHQEGPLNANVVQDEPPNNGLRVTIRPGGADIRGNRVVDQSTQQDQINRLTELGLGFYNIDNPQVPSGSRLVPLTPRVGLYDPPEPTRPATPGSARVGGNVTTPGALQALPQLSAPQSTSGRSFTPGTLFTQDARGGVTAEVPDASGIIKKYYYQPGEVPAAARDQLERWNLFRTPEARPAAPQAPVFQNNTPIPQVGSSSIDQESVDYYRNFLQSLDNQTTWDEMSAPMTLDRYLQTYRDRPEADVRREFNAGQYRLLPADGGGSGGPPAMPANPYGEPSHTSGPTAQSNTISNLYLSPTAADNALIRNSLLRSSGGVAGSVAPPPSVRYATAPNGHGYYQFTLQPDGSETVATIASGSPPAGAVVTTNRTPAVATPLLRAL